MMTLEQWITIITAVVMGVPGVAGLILAIRKAPLESKKIEADSSAAGAEAAESASHAAANFANQVIALQFEIGSLTCKLEEQIAKHLKTEARVTALELENADLRDWAERLVHQVKSLGHEPVPIRRPGERK